MSKVVYSDTNLLRMLKFKTGHKPENKNFRNFTQIKDYYVEKFGPNVLTDIKVPSEEQQSLIENMISTCKPPQERPKPTYKPENPNEIQLISPEKMARIADNNKPIPETHNYFGVHLVNAGPGTGKTFTIGNFINQRLGVEPFHQEQPVEDRTTSDYRIVCLGSVPSTCVNLRKVIEGISPVLNAKYIRETTTNLPVFDECVITNLQKFISITIPYYSKDRVNYLRMNPQIIRNCYYKHANIIIIDEIQNVSAEDFKVIVTIAHILDVPLWCFGDPRQVTHYNNKWMNAIFTSEISCFSFLKRYNLTRTYRFTEDQLNLINKFGGEKWKNAYPPLVLNGQKPDLYPLLEARTYSITAREIVLEIDTILKKYPDVGIIFEDLNCYVTIFILDQLAKCGHKLSYLKESNFYPTGHRYIDVINAPGHEFDIAIYIKPINTNNFHEYVALSRGKYKSIVYIPTDAKSRIRFEEYGINRVITDQLFMNNNLFTPAKNELPLLNANRTLRICTMAPICEEFVSRSINGSMVVTPTSNNIYCVFDNFELQNPNLIKPMMNFSTETFDPQFMNFILNGKVSDIEKTVKKINEKSIEISTKTNIKHENDNIENEDNTKPINLDEKQKNNIETTYYRRYPNQKGYYNLELDTLFSNAKRFIPYPLQIDVNLWNEEEALAWNVWKLKPSTKDIPFFPKNPYSHQKFECKYQRKSPNYYVIPENFESAKPPLYAINTIFEFDNMAFSPNMVCVNSIHTCENRYIGIFEAYLLNKRYAYIYSQEKIEKIEVDRSIMYEYIWFIRQLQPFKNKVPKHPNWYIDTEHYTSLTTKQVIFTEIVAVSGRDFNESIFMLNPPINYKVDVKGLKVYHYHSKTDLQVCNNLGETNDCKELSRKALENKGYYVTENNEVRQSDLYSNMGFITNNTLIHTASYDTFMLFNCVESILNKEN